MQRRVLKNNLLVSYRTKYQQLYSLYHQGYLYLTRQPSPVRESIFSGDVQAGREMDTKYIRKRKFERALNSD